MAASTEKLHTVNKRQHSQKETNNFHEKKIFFKESLFPAIAFSDMDDLTSLSSSYTKISGPKEPRLKSKTQKDQTVSKHLNRISQ